MINPRDDPETLARVYSSLQDPVYDSERMNRCSVARRRVKRIRQVTKGKADRLLDVGCATGIFAGAARDAGMQVTGIEPSAWSVREARKTLPDIRFVPGSVETCSFAEESFDVITLWDVLEHVASPRRVIGTLTPWLAENGWLFINVPNIDSLPARMMGKRWVLLLREHLWYFSPETIRQLLEPAGYDVVDIRANLVTFSLRNILKRIAQYSPEKLKFLSQQPVHSFDLLNAVVFRFPMGEMTVIAQKR
jgi:2-polyprenyl-3-methyl-5-hydroxy-6-metoxy-1,4-benzoquinol methylase